MEFSGRWQPGNVQWNEWLKWLEPNPITWYLIRLQRSESGNSRTGLSSSVISEPVSAWNIDLIDTETPFFPLCKIPFEAIICLRIQYRSNISFSGTRCVLIFQGTQNSFLKENVCVLLHVRVCVPLAGLRSRPLSSQQSSSGLTGSSGPLGWFLTLPPPSRLTHNFDLM